MAAETPSSGPTPVSSTTDQLWPGQRQALDTMECMSKEGGTDRVASLSSFSGTFLALTLRTQHPRNSCHPVPPWSSVTLGLNPAHPPSKHMSVTRCPFSTVSYRQWFSNLGLPHRGTGKACKMELGTLPHSFRFSRSGEGPAFLASSVGTDLRKAFCH